MFGLRHVFIMLARCALVLRDDRLVHPLEVHGRQFSWAHAVALFAHAPRAVLAPLLDHLGLLVGWQRQVCIIWGHVPDLAANLFDSSFLGCFGLVTCTGELLLWKEELSPGHPLIPAHQCLVLQSLFLFQLSACQLSVLQMPFPGFFGLYLLAVFLCSRVAQELLDPLQSKVVNRTVCVVKLTQSFCDFLLPPVAGGQTRSPKSSC